jgi:hypothetical protein
MPDSPSRSAAPPPPCGRDRTVRLALHLRRGDTWGVDPSVGTAGHAAASRSTKFVRRLSADERERLTHATRRSVATIVEALGHALDSPTARSPAAWLVLSDDASEAAAYAQLIRNASRSRQSAYVPPPGFATYSFLAMRHVDGIVQSAARRWSSFSSVPAIMGDVPLLAMNASGTWGVVPHAHVCSTVEQYVHDHGGRSSDGPAVGPCGAGGPSCLPAWLGGEAAFVARLLGCARTCKDPPPIRLRQAANQGALTHDAWRWLSAPQNQPRPWPRRASRRR